MITCSHIPVNAWHVLGTPIGSEFIFMILPMCSTRAAFVHNAHCLMVFEEQCVSLDRGEESVRLPLTILKLSSVTV